MKLPFEFWRKWLFHVSVGMVVFGMALAVGTPIRVLPMYHRAINRALWGVDAMPNDAAVFHHFMFGVLGATLASQAMLQAFIAATAFQRREKWAWWAIAAGMAIWFPLDTALSLYWGAWPNAVFNLGALAAVAIPLIGTYRAFFFQPSPSASRRELG